MDYIGGERVLTKRSRFIAFATALGVSVTDLTAQPLPPRGAEELAIHRMPPALRAALDEPLPENLQVAPIDRLRAEVGAIMAVRMACDYVTLSMRLPILLHQVRVLVAQGSAQARQLFCRVAGNAAMAIKSFGYVDLGLRLAERAQDAASTLGDEVEIAWSDYVFAQCALAAGLPVSSYARATQTAAALAGSTTPDGVACYGMLQLHAALAGAALGKSECDILLAEAAAAARRTDADPWRVEFGQANVAIWRIGIALERGEPERACAYARQVDRYSIRTVQRQARLHIDTGRAHYLVGDRKRAVRSFLAADDIAASEVRLRPHVREIVGQMIRDARRASGHDELRMLAVRFGLDPLDPPDPLT